MRRLALALAVVLGLLMLTGCNDVAATPSAPKAKPAVRVDAAGLWRHMPADHWSAGTWRSWGASRDGVQPVLHEDEVSWLTAHSTMPKTRHGAPLDKVTNKLGAMGRLTTVRVRDRRISPARLARYSPLASADSLDLRADRTGPEYDEQDGTYTLRLDRTVPAAGKPVSLNKGITLIAYWSWTPSDDDGDGVPDAEDDVDNYSYGGSGGGDDDDNIPGWLCPTRFC